MSKKFKEQKKYIPAIRYITAIQALLMFLYSIQQIFSTSSLLTAFVVILSLAITINLSVICIAIQISLKKFDYFTMANLTISFIILIVTWLSDPSSGTKITQNHIPFTVASISILILIIICPMIIVAIKRIGNKTK